MNPGSAVYTNVKNCCSQIYFTINNINYMGSGWFYTLSDADLANSFFVTAAHCAIMVSGPTYYKMTAGFIENPLTKKWHTIDVNNIYVDGVADIAVIKTGINFTDNSAYCLKLAANPLLAGDMCYIVGNPAGIDEDSICVGTVRDPTYCEPSGLQITESIHVSCPVIGGSSGSPILNTTGEVIGIYTFALLSYECFGGGSNLSVLRKSLGVLTTTLANYRSKRYLGLRWAIPNPFAGKLYYTSPDFKREGVLIKAVDTKSPFYGTLGVGDLLLSATTFVDSTPNPTIVFGELEGQQTPPEF